MNSGSIEISEDRPDVTVLPDQAKGQKKIEAVELTDQ